LPFQHLPNMNYPVEILPSPNHKWIKCPLSDHYLIRHCELRESISLKDPATGNIRATYICSPEEQISDLSTSLLGVYNLNHISIELTAEGKRIFSHYCQPNEEVDLPELNIHYFRNLDRHFWCASIRLLDGQSFEYTRGKDPFIAICKVVQTPMKWNYWHFSIRWDTDLGPLENLDEKLRRNVARRIGHSARVIISHFAKTELPIFPELPQTCYCTN
jgi:hypothetical protein